MCMRAKVKVLSMNAAVLGCLARGKTRSGRFRPVYDNPAMTLCQPVISRIVAL